MAARVDLLRNVALGLGPAPHAAVAQRAVGKLVQVVVHVARSVCGALRQRRGDRPCHLALFEAGVRTATALNEAGCTAAEVKGIGVFDKEDMEEGGYELDDATQMRDGGFLCIEVREAGYSASEAKEAGYTLEELKAAGYVEGLKEAGYTLEEVKAVGYVEGLKAAGYTIDEVKAAGYGPVACKASGFSFEEAKSAGYRAGERAWHNGVNIW